MDDQPTKVPKEETATTNEEPSTEDTQDTNKVKASPEKQTEESPEQDSETHTKNKKSSDEKTKKEPHNGNENLDNTLVEEIPDELTPKDIEYLKHKKDEYQEKANEFKKRRDELHDHSKAMAQERDEYNGRIRNLRNKINEHKSKRDEYNERVKHAKEQRNEYIEAHIETKKHIRDLQKNRSNASGINIGKLKQTLRKLENDQMTQALSAQKEKRLIENMRDINKNIKEEEEKINQDPKLKQALEEEVLLKDKAEKQHETVEKMAKKAQEEHQAMIEILKTLDNLVKKTTQIQEKIVETKIQADMVHKDFIHHVNTIHEIEKRVSGLARKVDERGRRADETAVKKEAQEILDKFNNGKKLSTEDLLMLQKAGLL